MERCRFAFYVASSAAASDVRTQFRRFIVLSLIGILISSKFSSVSALPPQTATNGDINGSNRSSVVANNTDEDGASSAKHIVVDTIRLRHRHGHRHYERFHPSSYVRSALLRPQQHLQQQKGRKETERHVNLRKLSSDFGCLANPSMCLTVPGWTTASNASTCCSDGFCTDVQFDGLNCGDCGNPCAFGYFCCSGECVPTDSDPQNCGGCGNACEHQICAFGFCGY